MYTVELWAQGAGFARFLQARLPGEAGGCLRLGPGAQRADLVVAAPDLAALPPNPAPCRALLLPGHLYLYVKKGAIYHGTGNRTVPR